ncbi:hypothetical protein C8Q74DRAFT_1233536 [Fomes fomentarius]|nr:hypothetical protein C8Q74DRAFT_1233536 [Fomes fomentarius]
MHSTLSAVGNTFDVVREQTMRVAALGPAVDATYQIRAVEEEVDEQSKRQEEKLQDMKKSLQERFKKHMREVIRPHVHQLVTDMIKREVAERVRHQLSIQIPSSLREEIRQYNWQIMQVKTSLHNSEARRHNALIRASGLDEPLQALLRPLDTPSTPGRADAPSDIQSSPRDAPANANSLQTPPSSPLQARLRNVVRGCGGDANRLSLNTNVSLRTSMAVTALGSPTSTHSTGGTAVGVWDVQEPTASPLFPRDLATLVSLGPEEARTLVREYGLIGEDENEGDVDEEVQVAAVRTPTGRMRRDPRPTSAFTTTSDGQSWVNAGLQGSREEDINRFMRFIGVGFQVLPSSPVITLGNGTSMTINGGGVSPGSPAIMKSPLVERPDYAFVR